MVVLLRIEMKAAFSQGNEFSHLKEEQYVDVVDGYLGKDES